MDVYVCDGCNRACPTANALRKHVERNQRSDGWNCRDKKARREEKQNILTAKQRVSNMNPTEVVETMNTSAKTNELLAQLSEDNKSL
eukprot:4556987-Prymnesium_polylepis.1